MRYRAIQENDRRYPIRLMCRALAVAPAGYYAWRVRPESQRGAANRAVVADIRVIYQESRQTYGSPSIWQALVQRGHRVGEHRVARLMRQAGIRAKTMKKWRATTQSDHRWPVAENTLNRQFTIARPNRVWAGDISYVWTAEGWLSLAVVLDLYSCAVIGWAMGARLTVDLAQQALTMAIRHRTRRPGCCTTRIGGASMLPQATSNCSPSMALLSACRDGGTVGTTPVSKASSGHSNANSSTIADTARVRKQHKTSLSISRCSIIGCVVTPRSATIPRPSSKRGPRWRNRVSTELG